MLFSLSQAFDQDTSVLESDWVSLSYSMSDSIFDVSTTDDMSAKFYFKDGQGPLDYETTWLDIGHSYSATVTVKDKDTADVDDTIGVTFVLKDVNEVCDGFHSQQCSHVWPISGTCYSFRGSN